MDKRYYYRILGLSDGATLTQVKAAYDKTVRKLKSPDYADDPEYVARRLDQARHAYSVLTGSRAPATKEQKDARFEKWKDAEDGGEDAIAELKRAFDKHVKNCVPQKKKTYYSPEEKARRGEDGKKHLSKFLVIGLALLPLCGSLLGACTAAVVNSADDILGHMSGPAISIEAEEAVPSEAVSPEAEAAIEHIIENCHLYDYFGHLDLSEQDEFMNQVEWEPGRENQKELWGEMTDLAYYLGVPSTADAVWYLTGNEDFYWESDDYGNASVLTLVMNPPEYEEIAGGTNLYSGEVILDYADYLRFLGDVAEQQTEEVMGYLSAY